MLRAKTKTPTISSDRTGEADGEMSIEVVICSLIFLDLLRNPDFIVGEAKRFPAD